MSGDTILVRLEAVGQRRFRRDMKVSSRAVAGLTKAHVRASKASKRHGRENKKLTAGLKVLGMVAGRAAGPQGVGMLAQAMQSATVAAAALTAAVGGLTAALGSLGSAAATGLRAVADAAGLAANRLRELAGLLWNAISASTVRGATAALAGMVPVLDHIRAAVRGVASAFAAVGTSMGMKMGAFGEIVPGLVPGAGPGGVAPTTAVAGAGSGTAGQPAGGKANAFSLLGSSTSKLGEVPAAAMPFAGLMTASIDEINKAALPGLIEGMASLNEAFQKIADSGALQQLGTVLGDAFSGVGGAIKEVVGYLEKTGDLGPAIMGVATAIGAFKVGMAGMSFVGLLAAANPITLIIAGIALLIGVLVYAYNRFEGFRNVVDAAWGVLKSIATWVAENWQLVIMSLLLGPIGTAVFFIVDNFNRIKNTVVGVLQGIWTWLTENWQLILGVLITPLSPVIGLIVANFGRIKSAATGALEWVKTAFTNTVNFFKGLPAQIASLGTRMWEGFKSGLNAALEWIVGKVNWFIRQYNKVGGAISKLPGVPDLTIGEITLGDPVPGDPGYSGPVRRAYGGSIPGGPPFDDRVPSLLTPGEHVWTRGEVKAAGGHRAVEELRRNVGRGASASSSASPAYVSVEAPVQVKIGEGVLADAMANVHLKVQAGIST